MPLAKAALHTVPQLIPEGLLVTVPDPVPATATVRVGPLAVVKFAVSDWLLFSVMTQGAVPVQAPLQPMKVEPDSAVAVKVILLPAGKLAEQVVPQLMPAGVLIIVPEPSPVR